MSNTPDTEASGPRDHPRGSPLGRLAERLGDAGEAFAENARNANLRRAQISFAAAWTGEWAFTTALGVYAYEQGGATAVGAIGLARMLPAALLSPLATALADRYRRERMLSAVVLTRAAGSTATAALIHAGAPALAVYVLAIFSTITWIAYRPTHSALLPLLCKTPRELSSANVVRGVLDGAGSLGGPLLAALMFATTNIANVFLAAALLALLSALALARISYEHVAIERAARAAPIFREALEGFVALRKHPDSRVLLGLGVAQTFVRGALNVFYLVVAIQLLDGGPPEVGVLAGAVGAGGLVGSIAASLLVASGRLAGWFGTGIALWGLPIAALGLWASPLAAVLLLAIVGIGNALVDVGLYTLLARTVPEGLLARMFGTLEASQSATLGLGSIVTPLAITALGVRGALIAIGGSLPVLAALCWRRLTRLDATMAVRDVEIALLRRVPMLRPLSVPTIEYLAIHVGQARTPAGEAVFEQGDPGDRFYVIADGQADVIGDGTLIRTIGPGDSFGEIALLRHVPRTTTVRARTDLQLHTLDRDRFLPAVSGYSGSAAEAETVVARQLATFRPAGLAM